MGANRRWTDAENKLILDFYRTASPEELCAMFEGRSYKGIQCQANRLGLIRPNSAWSEEELEILKEYYPVSTPQEIQKLLPERNNQTITHMANKLEIYREEYRWTDEEDDLLRKHYGNMKVKDLLKLFPNRTNNGIKLRARKLDLWQDKTLARRELFHNLDFFEKPNVINSYYAGFIAADGCVVGNGTILKISIQQDDVEILEAFKRDIKHTGEIKYVVSKPSPNSLSRVDSYLTDITICGAGKVCKDLEQVFNITAKKTLTLKPPNITGDNALAFIIGYIDGDGSIMFSFQPRKRTSSYPGISVEVAGTFAMLTWIKSIFDGISIPTDGKGAQLFKAKNENIWTYKVGGVRAAHILEVLEAVKTSIRLSRKWNKVTEYKKAVIERKVS